MSKVPYDAKPYGNFFLHPLEYNVPYSWKLTAIDGKVESLPPPKHITVLDYPYGTFRCQQIHWLEKRKGEFRHGSATTVKPWSIQYTQVVHAFRPREFNEANEREFIKALDELTLPAYNKPKYSVYQGFMVLYKEKKTGFIQCHSMTQFARPEDFHYTRQLFTHQGKLLLDEEQLRYLNAFEALARKTSPLSWEEWDAKNNIPYRNETYERI